jgi:hypothetical protein
MRALAARLPRAQRLLVGATRRCQPRPPSPARPHPCPPSRPPQVVDPIDLTVYPVITTEEGKIWTKFV